MTRYRNYFLRSLLVCSWIAAAQGCGKVENTPRGEGDTSGGDGDHEQVGDGDASGDGDGDASGDGEGATSGGASGSTGGTAGDGDGDGIPSGGAPLGGAGSGGNGAGATDGAGGSAARTDGPCDIYEAAGSPCAAAYSTIRSLRREYRGPLYQVRVGSSPYNIGGERVTNPEVGWDGIGQSPQTTVPEPGELLDIPQGGDGFADVSELDERCQSPTVCTISQLYDHSGNETHLLVAGGGTYPLNEFHRLPNFESEINQSAQVKVGGRDLYSLRTEPREGYRSDEFGTGMPDDEEPIGIYMLSDGTRVGTGCCFEFGSVPNIASFNEGTTLFFGEGVMGSGQTPPGAPWFGLSLEDDIFMGGSEPSDPGWGQLNSSPEDRPPNQENPSMQGVPFALGFVKISDGTNETEYALRMADISTATDLHTGYKGPYPAGEFINRVGAVILGIGDRHYNASYGTFYEGAIVAGYPDDATELEVMQNLQAVGYAE